ncbi:MAG: hypothetical protein PUJ28_03230 [Prevotellaceae bacterium]|nr:hypothetical protein [Prevotellaceae bacterium]
MTKKQYTAPCSYAIEVQGEEIIAQSPGLNDQLSDKDQRIKEIDLPMGPQGRDVVNRSLWDDQW